MSELTKLREDHSRLLVLANELSRVTALREPPCRLELFSLRTTLASVLIRHLKEEDWIVYPKLFRSNDRSLRDAAHALHQESGNLTDEFRQYAARWSAGTIESDWTGYRRDTSGFLKKLKQRIAREDKSLYGVAADEMRAAAYSK